MDAKSVTPEELQTSLLNSVESLSKQMEKLQETLKKTNEILSLNITASRDLRETVGGANKIFEQVSQGLKDIYVKVQGLELVSKLMGNLGLGNKKI